MPSAGQTRVHAPAPLGPWHRTPELCPRNSGQVWTVIKEGQMHWPESQYLHLKLPRFFSVLSTYCWLCVKNLYVDGATQKTKTKTNRKHPHPSQRHHHKGNTETTQNTPAPGPSLPPCLWLKARDQEEPNSSLGDSQQSRSAARALGEGCWAPRPTPSHVTGLGGHYPANYSSYQTQSSKGQRGRKGCKSESLQRKTGLRTPTCP